MTATPPSHPQTTDPHHSGNTPRPLFVDAPPQVRPMHGAPLATADLQVDPDPPAITPAQSLNGWHRELCVQLLGEGAARIFVRVVRHSSLKASELREAILFHRLDPRFSDLAGCVGALRPDLERLAKTAQRSVPSKDNLFVTLNYDRDAWERVEQGVDRWARR